MIEHCEHPNDLAVADGPGWRLAIDNDADGLDADGWCLIAPFGEHPKTRLVRDRAGRVVEQKFIQVLDNESADALLSHENSFFRRLRRALVGVPVYKGGHPDMADYAPETIGASDAKKSVVGVVDRVRKGPRGIEAHFSLTPEGAAAVENEGCKYPSAFWYVTAAGQRGAAILARPFRLISACITAHPNIPGVDSLANARGAETQTNDNTDMKLIAGWLLGQGVALANAEAPTESQVLDGLQRHFAKHTADANAIGFEKSNLSGKVAALENELAPLRQKFADAAAALAGEQNARRSERVGRAEAVADLAIARGKITVAQRDAEAAALANCTDETAFAATADRLLKRATLARTLGGDGAGERRALANDGLTQCDPRVEYKTRMDEEMKSTSDPVKAHASVMRKYPDLAEKFRVREAA